MENDKIDNASLSTHTFTRRTSPFTPLSFRSDMERVLLCRPSLSSAAPLTYRRRKSPDLHLRKNSSSFTPTLFSSCRPLHLSTSFRTPSLKSSNRLRLSPIRSSDTVTDQVTSPPPSSSGVKLVPFALSVGIGLIVRFLVPIPPEVTVQAWQLLSIFLSTIAGLVLSPLPVGAWSLLSLTTVIFTRTLSFETAFKAYTNEVIWLIVISFFFARGFVKTGLGDRIATYFVKWLGKSTLGLSYGLTISEALVAPAMPSTTARAGGVFLPIIKSLSLSAGSKPNDPSAKKIGSYLIQSQFQV